MARAASTTSSRCSSSKSSTAISSARENPPQSFLPHLYGGQVAAQAARAASLTVPEDRFLHSLHGYFLRPGHSDRPTILRVDRDRDGGSFSARHVNALQNGEVILSLLVSFHRERDGREFQETATCGGAAAGRDARAGDRRAQHDVRPATGIAGPDAPRWPGLSHRFWARTWGALPDDRLIHECALTYLSDMGTGFMKIPTDEPMGGPSLDHALWFHRPVRMDEWVLVDLEPVVASGSRASTREPSTTLRARWSPASRRSTSWSRARSPERRSDHLRHTQRDQSSSVRPSSPTNTSWLCSPRPGAGRTVAA